MRLFAERGFQATSAGDIETDVGLLAWVTLRRAGVAWNLLRAILPFALVGGEATNQ